MKNSEKMQTELFDPPKRPQPLPSEPNFSKYVVYVDESGDHNLVTIDAQYPVFVLALCVFHKRHYGNHVVPQIQKFKFDHFGHDIVVLHEHEIRKEKGLFRFASATHKNAFLGQLTDVMDASNFVLIACVIDKRRMPKGVEGDNPYHIALQCCLEALYRFLEEKNQNDHVTHVVVESRGKKEDNDLELEFLRICNGSNRRGIRLPFEVVFANKQVNSAGLQLADLVARPIGLHVFRPDQPNRAFEVLRKKLLSNGGRENAGSDYDNAGLRIFPDQESEKPR
jgi:hypothetical protein